MGTFISARAISTVREIWWDIRPHPDFGTIELRMCDAMPTTTEMGRALAALAQSLVEWFDGLMDRGYTLPPTLRLAGTPKQMAGRPVWPGSGTDSGPSRTEKPPAGGR